MRETTLSELARVVAELAETVSSAEPNARRLAHRARTLCAPLRPDDPARWTLSEQTVTVELDVPARVVAETLVNEGTGAVVVVSSEGPVGIVAERDLATAVAAGKDLGGLAAADLIAPDLVTASSDATIAEVATLMVRHHVRHLPLVDAQRIAGIISSLDLVRALGGTDASGPETRR